MKQKFKKYLWLIIGSAFLVVFAVAITLYFVLKEDIKLEGEGTKESPYLISDGDGLYSFAKSANGSITGLEGKYFLLTSDIDLKGAEWTPIADGNAIFKGTFNGNGKTIKNFTINSDYEYAGFFAKISGSGDAGIYGLSLDRVKMTSSAEIRGLGVIAGHAEAKIADCTVNAEIKLSGNTAYVGGIAGSSNAEITDCSVYGTMTVSAKERIEGQNSTYEWPAYAGIAGYSYADITNCVNNMKITMTRAETTATTNRNIHVGGISGSASGSSYKNCVNNADIKAVGALGGIIGTLNNEKTVIESCKNYGSLTSESDILCDIGGIMSRSYTSGNGLPEIKNCYNGGDIDLTSSLKTDGGNGVSVPVCWAGGISATGNVNVTACAAVCDVSVRGAGTHYAGGLAGGITGTMLNSYHIGNVRVESESSIIAGGVVGVLQDISYYGGDKSQVNIAIKNCYNSGAVYIRIAENTHVPVSNFLAGGVVGFNMIADNEIKSNYFDETAVENFDAPQGFISCKYWYGEEVPGMAENVEGSNISFNGGLTEAELKGGDIVGFDSQIWIFENGSYPKLYWEK